VGVVVARKVQLARAADERRAQFEADDGVTLELVVQERQNLNILRVAPLVIGHEANQAWIYLTLPSCPLGKQRRVQLISQRLDIS